MFISRRSLISIPFSHNCIAGSNNDSHGTPPPYNLYTTEKPFSAPGTATANPPV